MKRHGDGDHGKPPVANAMVNLDSRLLGAEHFKSKDLKELLKAAFPDALGAQQRLLQGHLVSGNATWKKPEYENSVLPAWRKTYVHLIGYNYPGKANANSLRKLAPDTGAYANEVRLSSQQCTRAQDGR
jgi:hypothetical protein